MSLIRFDTEQISAIAAQTAAHQQHWDTIWNDVRAKLGGVIGEALDVATGMSLEERSVRYQQRTAIYTQQLMQRAAATAQVGMIAEQTGAAMVRALMG